MKHQIRYTYDTGDSFTKNLNCTGILEFTWTSLDIAKENLQRIKEHYEYYEERKGPHTKKGLKEIEKQAATKEWYVKQYDHCLFLKSDNGTEAQISAPWCGYFEDLVEAEIVSEDPELKISFR